MKSATVQYALEPNDCNSITRVRTKWVHEAPTIFRFVKRFNVEQHNIIFDAFIRLMFFFFVIVVCQTTATKGCNWTLKQPQQLEDDFISISF